MPPPPSLVREGDGTAGTPTGDARLMSIVQTGIAGITLEIPAGLIQRRPHARVSVQTLSASNVSHLAEGSQTRRGQFLFSPVVRVDYPAFEEGEAPPDLGEPVAPPFDEPLILSMPHSFHPTDGYESCVFLGAPHGGTECEPQLPLPLPYPYPYPYPYP